MPVCAVSEVPAGTGAVLMWLCGWGDCGQVAVPTWMPGIWKCPSHGPVSRVWRRQVDVLVDERLTGKETDR